MPKIKKFHLYRPEFIVESKPKIIGIPLAYLTWFIKCQKIFKIILLKKHCLMFTIPKFKKGSVNE